MMVYYKVLNGAGGSIAAGFGTATTYDLPRGDEPGAWAPPRPTTLREPGYFVSRSPMWWPQYGMRVFECQTRDDLGPMVELSPIETMVSTLRLTRERPDMVPQWWHDVERFVDELLHMAWFRPTSGPDPAWRLGETRADAERIAQVSSDYDEMFHMELQRIQHMRRGHDDNTRQRMEEQLSGIMDLLGGETARKELGEDEGLIRVWGRLNADPDVRDDAYRDVILMGNLLLCGGLKVEPALAQMIRTRWGIWRRGYGVHSFKAGKASIGKFTVYRCGDVVSERRDAA